MRKLAAALATFTIVTAGLAAGAGPASAKSESWAGVKPATSHWTGKKLGTVKHVKPAADQWTGKNPRSEVWS